MFASSLLEAVDFFVSLLLFTLQAQTYDLTYEKYVCPGSITTSNRETVGILANGSVAVESLALAEYAMDDLFPVFMELLLQQYSVSAMMWY